MKFLGSVVPVIIGRSYLSLSNLREYNLKCQIRLHMEFERSGFEMQCLIMTDTWFVSESFAILAKNDICHSLGEALDKINSSFDTFVQGGLGWTVHKFIKTMLVVDRCKRFKARCTGGKGEGQEGIAVYTKHSYRSVFSLCSCGRFSQGVVQSSAPLIIQMYYQGSRGGDWNKQQGGREGD